MRGKIVNIIKSFMWGEAKKKIKGSVVKILKHRKEGRLGIKNPNSAFNARKITMLKKIITKHR